MAVEVSTEAWHDGEVFGGLIEQIEGSIEQMDADGAYDTAACDEGAQVAGATWVVPPRENAVPWEEGPPRTEALKQIEAKGREEGKKTGGYPRRSLAENAMYRVKQWLGDRWASRLFQTQVVEAHARGAVRLKNIYAPTPTAAPAWPQTPVPDAEDRQSARESAIARQPGARTAFSAYFPAG